MADSPDRLPFDDAFDQAFEQLMTRRAEYEADPRDPERYAALATARARLDDARTTMDDERRRLGLTPRAVHLPPPLLVDSDGQAEWQGTQQ